MILLLLYQALILKKGDQNIAPVIKAFSNSGKTKLSNIEIYEMKSIWE